MSILCLLDLFYRDFIPICSTFPLLFLFYVNLKPILNVFISYFSPIFCVFLLYFISVLYLFSFIISVSLMLF